MDELTKRKIIWDDLHRRKLAGNSAASILNGGRSQVALLKFSNLLNHSDPVMRSAAITSLVKVGGSEAANLIARKIKDSSPQVRAQACWGLGQLRHQPARTMLFDSLRDPFLPVVLEAAVALHLLGDKTGYHRIVQLLRIPGDHREETKHALTRITRQKFRSGKPGIKDALRWINTRRKLGA
ncbi:MAG: HEAT repeat domain-containing protein [Sedimentisphaerales bacterium]|nr:HEAT repeat domain-containing protein [Sedimentisphaerales bacterium]